MRYYAALDGLDHHLDLQQQHQVSFNTPLLEIYRNNLQAELTNF